MRNDWPDRVLGWGLALALHGLGLIGATFIIYYPHHCCEGGEVAVDRFKVFYSVEPVERPRDIVDRRGRPQEELRPPFDFDSTGEIVDHLPRGSTHLGPDEADKSRRPLPRTTASTENAVTAALRWLARHQNPDGSWSADGFSRHCSGAPCGGAGLPGSDYEATRMAMRVFIRAGYFRWAHVVHVDPAVPDRELRFGDVMEKAWKWQSEQLIGCGFVTGTSVAPDVLLSTQKTVEQGCANGSWDPAPELQGLERGRVYAVATNALRLLDR